MKSILGFALALCACAILGCGSSEGIKPTDEQNVFASVEGLGDIAGDEAMFADAFVPGSVPENRREYSERGYQVTGEPTYAGDQVTVPVKIFGVMHATSSSESRAKRGNSVAETQQTWTLEQVDGQWKLKDAPLG
ncbi:hypothetical protein [Allorhodopirellula solitaria]|nr:hypothetical protein [Allorhodopirellula solitaria]